MNNIDENPSAPAVENDIQFTPFYKNIYPQIPVPEFNSNDYRINRIMKQYEFLENEMKTRGNLKKKYCKLSKTFFGIECFFTLTELGMIGVCITLPVAIPFGVPISAGLTTFSAILRTSASYVGNKIKKHSDIELLAKTKLNSIEEKFTNALKDGKISDEEFSNIEQEIKNYNEMKTNILNGYKNNDTEKAKLLEKGKELGKAEIINAIRKNV